MAFILPLHLLNPSSFKFTKSRRVLSGGSALSGVEDVVETDGGGYWTVTISNISLITAENLRLWEAWDNHLQGGSREFLLPVASVLTSPRPFAGKGAMTPSNLIHEGDRFFPTAVRRASPYIIAKITATAEMGDTEISLTVQQGSRVTGGEKFSVEHDDGPGFYSIERVTSAAGQSATVKIWPPLRNDAANNASLNFDWPLMRARLQPGYDMQAEIEYGRTSTVQATFVEATGSA